MKQAARRVALESLGWLLVVGGIAGLILPGPGLLGLFAGLVLLSQQYEWAERRVDPVKKKALRGAAESVQTWPRIVVSCVIALVIVASGVLWCVRPAAPSWWPVADHWWLIGGWPTGITEILSGLFALGMIIYSYRRFRVRGEDPADAESSRA